MRLFPYCVTLVCVGACVGDSTIQPQPDASTDSGAPDNTVADAGPNEAGSEAGPFDGNFYGNLELWLSADVGASAVVSSWTDRSNQHRTVAVPTTGTCTSPPALVASAIHGLPVVSFNGQNTCLSVSGSFADFTGGFTAFTVLQPAACNSTFLGNAGSVFASWDNSSSAFDIGIAIGRNPTPAQNATGDALLSLTGLLEAPRGAVAIVGGGSWVPGTPEILEFRLPGAPQDTLVSGTAYVNGTLASLGENDPQIPEKTVARNTTFIGLNPSNNTSEYELYCGAIGEMLIYSKALSDGDRQAVQTYLKVRWGL